MYFSNQLQGLSKEHFFFFKITELSVHFSKKIIKTKMHREEYKQVITVSTLSADPYTNPDEC